MRVARWPFCTPFRGMAACDPTIPTYVTYLEVSLNPKSAAPTEIVSSLKNLGWKPVFGQYDFAYAWEANWNGDWNGKNPATTGQTAPGYGTAGGHGGTGGVW